LHIEGSPLEGPNTTFWSISKGGAVVGKVTSAVYSPRLEKHIALAMVATGCADLGTGLEIEMPGGTVEATVVERPFYDPKKKLATG